MAGYPIVVIGGSAGAVEVLGRIASELPADLRAALFVVVHFPSDAVSVLPRILNRAGPLNALNPADGDPIRPGQIYIAPPDHHLLVGKAHMHVTRGPKENGHRPAVDPLFRSAARSFGPGVIGLVLSGNLDDGTAGLQVIAAQGGVALVHDPEEALYPGMPASALHHVAGARSLPAHAIGATLVELVSRLAPAESSTRNPEDATMPEQGAGEYGSAREDVVRPDPDTLGSVERAASGLSCPECHGSLWEESEGEVLRFRCRVGHAYSSDSLLSEHTHSVEAALWSALNALEEKADLARRMARRLSSGAARRFLRQAEDSTRQAQLLREVLLSTSAGAVPLQDDLVEMEDDRRERAAG